MGMESVGKGSGERPLGGLRARVGEAGPEGRAATVPHAAGRDVLGWGADPARRRRVRLVLLLLLLVRTPGGVSVALVLDWLAGAALRWATLSCWATCE